MSDRFRYPYYTNRYYYNYYGPYYAEINRSDQEIREDVERNLRWDSWVDSNQVNIEVQNRIVTLTGTVDSLVEKRAAGDDAWDTIGVVDVYNNLQVHPSGQSNRTG